MREIKFRAWVLSKRIFYDVQMIDWSENEIHNGGDVEKLSDVILQQYTGLKDKNGKEICEGDIVKTDDVGMCEVEWLGSGLGLHTLPRDSSRQIFAVWYHEGEVIGNVYKNPELLEAK